MQYKTWLMVLGLAICLNGLAQETHFYTDKEKDFKRAEYHIQQGDYALAYPIVQNLKHQLVSRKISDEGILLDEVEYFDILCGLQLQHETASEKAENFLATQPTSFRKNLLSYHLAHYYFLNKDFEKTIEYYNKAGVNNLSNNQLATAKFEQAYALMNLSEFGKAKTLFNEISQLKDGRYYLPSNYYFGFLSFNDKEYENALNAFRVVESAEEYKGVVPYYISQIYYTQGRTDEAMQYVEQALRNGNTLYYEKEMKLLLGQLYFERQNYARAMPLLRDYYNQSGKVSRQVLYELSYSYYKLNDAKNAISGFKQLSSEKDSLGQNAMYVLGDLYLQAGDKQNARNAFQFSAANSSNAEQQKISKFHYGKLSYDMGYNDVALRELNAYIRDYPNSEYDKEAREILVNLFANSNNYREALQLFDGLQSPSSAVRQAYPGILLGRAVELINDGQLVEAQDLLNRALSSNANATVSANANFWKGEIALRQKRYDDAILFTNNYLSGKVAAVGEANEKNANYNLGYSYFQMENYNQAINHFQKVVSNISSNSSAIEQDGYLRMADAYYMQRNYSRAAEMYDRVIGLRNNFSDYARYQKAMIAGLRSSNDKIEQLKAIVASTNNSMLKQDAIAEIAQTYMADERFGEAIPFLNSIINDADEGNKPRAYLRLALAQFNANKNADALKTIETLLAKYPNSSEATEATPLVRDIYVDEGRPNEYLNFMARNGKQVSTSEADELLFNAAYSKYEKGDCTDAIKDFTSYLNRFATGQNVINANFYLAECYSKNKETDNALGRYILVSKAGAGPNYEAATLATARIYYLDKKDYANARTYFEALNKNAVTPVMQLEAKRGLVRTLYQTKDYKNAGVIANELALQKGISSDDKAIALLVLGKTQQLDKNYKEAIQSFRSVAQLNKAAWGAEAQYEVANSLFKDGNLSEAEKAGMTAIKNSGSYDYWVTKSYILLGDIFLAQKDYFNAKATFESVANNADSPELKNEAKEKLIAATAAERAAGKIN